MKKILLGSFFLFPFLVACVDHSLPLVNGMWQLKTIQDEGITHNVDTIFYSFQRQVLFSCTVLYEKKGQPSTSVVTYGYIDFPDKETLSITLDKNNYHKAFLLPWNLGKTEEEMLYEVAYDIVKLNSTQMILSYRGKNYHFIKY